MSSTESAASAQRLSASKRIALYFDQSPFPRNLCSTPFGIKEDRTDQAEALRIDNLLCSTPFGIKEDRTSEGQAGSPMKPMCSTPFGIKEDRTLPPGTLKPHSPPRAQRLSASKRIARRSAKPSAPSDKRCSTPFGIKEDRTLQPRRGKLGQRVLNAFRHQRGSHPPHRPRPAAFREVLNAFRHQRGSHTQT